MIDPRALALLLVTLVACSGPDDEKPSETDDTAAPVAGPCADGWGPLTDPEAALHVRADGDDAADGSVEHPVATLDAALAIARADGGLRTIFVGPGEDYVAQLSLAHETSEGTTDDGLSLLGCGADEVVVRAADDTAPVLKVSGVVGLHVQGLTISGGRRAVWIWQGAQVSVAETRVQDATRVGIVVDGAATVVDLVDVEVADTAPQVAGDGAEIGYGVSVQGGTLTMSGGGISGSTSVGLLADFALIDLQDVDVTGTSADGDGRMGRGIQIQDLTAASIAGGRVADNADAGVFALRAAEITLAGVEVTATLAATVPGAEETTGDAIVITQGDSDFEPSTFIANLDDNVVGGADRAGVVIDGHAVEVVRLSGNAVTDAAYAPDGVGILVQNDAIVPTSGDPTYTLGEPLRLNVVELAVDDLTE